VLEAGGTLAAAIGEIDYELTGLDLAATPILLALGVAAAAGLFRRRVWGWWAAIANVALNLVGAAVSLPLDREFLDPEFGPGSLAALGVVLLFGAGLLALLDARSIRDSLLPHPPSARLPVERCAFIGVALFALGLALIVVWGWFILALWLAILALRRNRRKRQPHVA